MYTCETFEAGPLQFAMDSNFQEGIYLLLAAQDQPQQGSIIVAGTEAQEA